MAQQGWHLAIAREYLFTGDLGPIQKAVIVGSPEYALNQLQTILDANHIEWKNTGEPLNLTRYALGRWIPNPADYEDEADMQDDIRATVVDFYIGDMRDGNLWLEEMDVYIPGG